MKYWHPAKLSSLVEAARGAASTPYPILPDTENTIVRDASDWVRRRTDFGMIGTATITLTSGIVLHQCIARKLHSGALVVALPRSRQIDRDGNPVWVPMLSFDSPEIEQQFQIEALRAIGHISSIE